MPNRGKTILALLIALAVLAGASTGWRPLMAGAARAQHEEHNGHYPEGADGDPDHEGHEGHDDVDHPADDGLHAHGDEEELHGDGEADGHAHGEDDLGEVRLSAEAIRRAGIGLAVAGPGTIDRQVRLPGEIRLNEDRAAHIVPRAEGIVTDVRARVGDRVKAGQVLATLESAELAEAKLQYLTAQGELGCCAIDLARAEALRTSAEELLVLLTEGPSLEDLLNAELADMSEAHSDLVSAYAELVLTKTTYEREEELVRSSVSSVAEHQEARNAYQKAYGAYIAARSALAFETQRDLFEAQRSRENTELEVRTARKTLRILGLSAEDVEALDADPAGPEPAEACDDPNCQDCAGEGQGEATVALDPGAGLRAADEHGHACEDPNCTDCAEHKPRGEARTLPALAIAVHAAEDGGHVCEDPDCTNCGEQEPHEEAHHDHEPADHFGLYSLRAPFDGIVTQKHITVGEKLSTDADAFTIADMSTVWVDLSVYQKDLPYVAEGQTVHFSVGEGVPDVEGRVAYVFPIVDEITRTCTARAIVPNPELRFRPGLFVSADVHVGLADAGVLVPKSAVQHIEGESAVFVPAEGGFEARPVKVGRTSATHVEILAGLEAGNRFVETGAFQLKAHIVTSGLGAHAGHGH